MKKSFCILLFFYPLITMVSARQDTISVNNSSSRLPQKENIGFTLNLLRLIDTISIGSFKDHIGNNFLLARYYYNDNSTIRLGFGFNLNNEKYSIVDSVGSAQIRQDSSYKRTDFYFSPGFEKHFNSGKNLDPYLASTISIGKMGRTKIRNIITTTDTTGKTINDITFDMEGGYLIGVNLIAGFNYFFSEKISIGAEYGLGINSSRYGGDWSAVNINTPASGSQTVKRKIGSLSLNTTKINMNANAGIMLSYFF